MAGRWDAFQGLPHGWEVRFDGRTGRYYFIDHISKQTSWEDPRLKSCPPPPPHPETLPAEMRAQQENQSHPLHQNVTNTSGVAGTTHQTMGLDSGKLGGPRSSDSSAGFGLTAQQESGLLEAVEHSQLAIAKISAMFPTVPETHIKDLMRKYHNREAVVISALQVQKHPLATPGPYGTFTPPPMRHFIPTATALMALQSTKSSVNTTGMTDVSAADITSSTATTTITSEDKVSTQIHTTATSNGTSVTTTLTDQPAITSLADRIPYRPIYERARGTHLLEEKTRRSPLVGQRGSMEKSAGSPKRRHGSTDRSVGSQRLGQGSLERSIGSPFLGRDSPLLSSRASSPHTFMDGSPRPTTRSVSEFTRSLMGSPRPYSPRSTPHSPKIKLRYLKGIFPKVEPTIILDILTQCNYNVKDASEKLVEMGHEKKDISLAPPKLKDRPDGKENKAIPKPSPGPPRPKNLSEKHKKKVRNQLISDYPDITPTVVTMALQSVFYEEERARQVLANMAETERKTQETLASTTPQMSRRSETKDVNLNVIGSPPLTRREGTKASRPTLPRTRINTAWTAAQTVSTGTSTDEDPSFKSGQRTKPTGPNTRLHRGPCEGLLLTDYQAWHGPNPENLKTQCKTLAQGPNRSHARGPSGRARGQDPGLRKGPQGLAKGPQFTQGIKKEPSFSTKML
ncbi:uncharacterized protein LOC122243613 isoform X2 [Penaeus japonicus]|uniref:uncharacterized protein LOC122243613 isoform X2 n=1 Tax=Penaeus japonicus TaxID=27405 RepID=UPI001C70C8FB|nr:uncharacterized protein LOC122243613 isoform X2 [Penaeus japonicus]